MLAHLNKPYTPDNRKRDDWHGQAACRKPWVNPGWFFGRDADNSDQPAQTYGDDGLRARLICSACPVFVKCWEENRDAEFGIFAGTDEVDRHRMVRAAQRKAERTAAKTGAPVPAVTIADLPVPRFTPHIATGSTAVQIALYAFLRGNTLQESAEVAELPLNTVQQAATGGSRYCRYAS